MKITTTPLVNLLSDLRGDAIAVRSQRPPFKSSSLQSIWDLEIHTNKDLVGSLAEILFGVQHKPLGFVKSHYKCKPSMFSVNPVIPPPTP